MSDSGSRYPEDEFDVLGRDRVPQGVHRARVPRWRSWLSVLAVIVAGVLLALGLVNLMGGGSAPSASTSPATTSTSPGADPEASATDGVSPESTRSPEPDPEEADPEETEPGVELDQSAAVAVLNGAGVAGLATSVQETLAAAGWSQASPGDYQSAEPTVSTVYYNGPQLAAEARAIAEELGIVPVQQYSGVTSITVVLRPDFVG